MVVIKGKKLKATDKNDEENAEQIDSANLYFPSKSFLILKRIVWTVNRGIVALKVDLKQPNAWNDIVLLALMCKTEYNVIAYMDKPHLKTDIELLHTKKEIARRLEENLSDCQFRSYDQIQIEELCEAQQV